MKAAGRKLTMRIGDDEIKGETLKVWGAKRYAAIIWCGSQIAKTLGEFDTKFQAARIVAAELRAIRLRGAL